MIENVFIRDETIGLYSFCGRDAIDAIELVKTSTEGKPSIEKNPDSYAYIEPISGGITNDTASDTGKMIQPALNFNGMIPETCLPTRGARVIEWLRGRSMAGLSQATRRENAITYNQSLYIADNYYPLAMGFGYQFTHRYLEGWTSVCGGPLFIEVSINGSIKTIVLNRCISTSGRPEGWFAIGYIGGTKEYKYDIDLPVNSIDRWIGWDISPTLVNGSYLTSLIDGVTSLKRMGPSEAVCGSLIIDNEYDASKKNYVSNFFVNFLKDIRDNFIYFKDYFNCSDLTFDESIKKVRISHFCNPQGTIIDEIYAGYLIMTQCSTSWRQLDIHMAKAYSMGIASAVSEGELKAYSNQYLNYCNPTQSSSSFANFFAKALVPGTGFSLSTRFEPGEVPAWCGAKLALFAGEKIDYDSMKLAFHDLDCLHHVPPGTTILMTDDGLQVSNSNVNNVLHLHREAIYYSLPKQLDASMLGCPWIDEITNTTEKGWVRPTL